MAADYRYPAEAATAGSFDDAENPTGGGGRGTWKHAAFHVATTIATPAAYAPLPFALASLGWPLGVCSLVGGTFATWYSSFLIASLWGWNGEKHTTYRLLAKSIFGKKIDRKSIDYSMHGSSVSKIFKAFNALGAIAFSFGDAMLPEIQSTMSEPAKKNMYKGVSAAYGIITLTYWQLAFSGYWAFGSQVQPYILSSLTAPQWTIVMANMFAVIQISGCFQIYCRPTYAYFDGRAQSESTSYKQCVVKCLWRLIFTSVYMVLITLIAAAMPFFGDFVAVCGAVGFTPLDFVFPALAFLKAAKMPKTPRIRLAVQIFNLTIAIGYSVVALLGCIGAVRFIVIDLKTYKFFHDM